MPVFLSVPLILAQENNVNFNVYVSLKLPIFNFDLCNLCCYRLVFIIGTPAQCVFPFKYGDYEFTSCAYDPPDIHWCSYQQDANGVHVLGQYIYCNCTNGAGNIKCVRCNKQLNHWTEGKWVRWRFSNFRPITLHLAPSYQQAFF